MSLDSARALVRQKIEVSQRIIDGPSNGDPIVHGLVVEELKRQVPRLQAKARYLETKGRRS